METIKKLVQESSLSKCTGALSGLDALVNSPSYLAIKNITENSVAASLKNSGLLALQRDMKQRQELWNSCFKGYTTVLESIKPVLENYNRVAELTCVSKEMANILQPLSASSIALQSLKPMSETLSLFGEVSTLVMNKPSLLTHLHSALESQIDTSLWDYWDYTEEISEDNIDSSMEDEIVAIVSEENKEGLIQQFISRYGEKGKKVLIFLVKWLIATFMGGLMTFYCEPVYKMMIPSALRQDQSVESTQIEEIPVNTEIHVWGDVTNNFIEISYSIDDKEYQGYISKEELENNSQKISNEVEWEHVVFINEVVQLLAEKWNLECDTVYKFLKDDTTILNDYILEHYDVLCFIDKEELVNVIEQYCDKEGIVIPKLEKESID